MARHEVVIDKDLCIGCGLCEKDCVSGVIKVSDGKACVKQSGCIACGHCEAICPKNAVTLTGFEDESVYYENQTRLDPDTLMAAIKTRRTIRNFTDKAVDEQIVNNIIEAGRLAPTGANSQRTGFIILGSRQDELESAAVRKFRRLLGVARTLVPALRSFNLDDNFFFKKAPLVIVITGNKVDASLAAENMAFMAESYGLGVLFSGFFTMCVNSTGKIRKTMGLHKAKAVTTLVIGYPSVRYHRTARREPAKLTIL